MEMRKLPARYKTPKQQLSDGGDPTDSAGACKPSADAAAGVSLSPGLYVVATPIGNLGDITFRAVDVLRRVDLIACEDTRVSRKLLEVHGIKTRLVAYHDHNAEIAGPRLLERLAAGERIALISDAGTPLISDPGYRLVNRCHALGIPVVPIPGASSVVSLLSVAGLPTDRFFFLGFLPTRATQIDNVIAEIQAIRATVVFMESPRRLSATLRELAVRLGDRQTVVGRELTKKFEELRGGTLMDLAIHYAEAGPPKGEVVVAIAPPDEALHVDDAMVDQALTEAMTRETPSRAAAEVAAATGRSKKDVYKRALALKPK